jgi:hypothetical protein
MHGSQPNYWPPVVMDYGDLRGMTAAFDPLAAARGADLSFSSPDQGAVGGQMAGGGEYLGAGVGGAGAGGGGDGGGSSGGGAGGGGDGSLPFTGLAVGAMAAAGAALTAAGSGLRRFARRRTSGS